MDLGSFISRFFTFRCAQTSADPFRLVCIRLALHLSLSLPSRLAPSAILTVGVPPRALCMVTYSKRSMDQPGKVANPARGQLNREDEYLPVRIRA